MTSETPTMTFEDAMLLVKAGKGVRRNIHTWGNTTYAHFVQRNNMPGRIFVRVRGNPNFYSLALTSDDVMADDWVEVEPEPIN